MCGNSHHGARSVRIQHVIGGIDGDFLSVDGIDRVRSDKNPRFFTRSGEALDFVGLRRIFHISENVRLLFFGRQLLNKGMLGGKDDIRDAEQSIRPRRKHAEFISALTGKFNLAAEGFSDPVALHRFGVFGPVDIVQALQQFFGVLGDLKKPLRQIFFDDRRAAALAGAVHNLFVCEHRIAGRAPVDGRFLAVSESVLV